MLLVIGHGIIPRVVWRVIGFASQLTRRMLVDIYLRCITRVRGPLSYPCCDFHFRSFVDFSNHLDWLVFRVLRLVLTYLPCLCDFMEIFLIRASTVRMSKYDISVKVKCH